MTTPEPAPLRTLAALFVAVLILAACGGGGGGDGSTSVPTAMAPVADVTLDQVRAQLMDDPDEVLLLVTL